MCSRLALATWTSRLPCPVRISAPGCEIAHSAVRPGDEQRLLRQRLVGDVGQLRHVGLYCGLGRQCFRGQPIGHVGQFRDVGELGDVGQQHHARVQRHVGFERHVGQQHRGRR
jgi:hypothetical protein